MRGTHVPFGVLGVEGGEKAVPALGALTFLVGEDGLILLVNFLQLLFDLWAMLAVIVAETGSRWSVLA